MALLGLWALLASACSAVPESAADPGAAASASRPTGQPQCRRTVVGVAHPDDDLFFFNPEILHTLRAGCGVDTVYLTAGDAGERERVGAMEYVDRREYGVRAAYADMAGAAGHWERADVDADGVRVRSYRLADDARTADVRLTFLDLHDGLPYGQEPDSLLNLFSGRRQSVEPFQSTERWTQTRLLAVLSALVRLSGAERLLVMDHDNASFAYGLGGRVDHADHGIGARYFRRVGYGLGVPVTAYLGYTVSPLRPNLTAADAAEKDEVARWYLAHRRCRASGTCANVSAYPGPLQRDWRLWIHREYQRIQRAPRTGELLGDIGRTTYFTGRDPSRCLHAATGPGAPEPVGLRACDGSAAQRWDMRDDGTVRPRLDGTLCLTARAPAVGLGHCADGGADGQRWKREPWQSDTWRREAWRIVGEGDRCLFQDDHELPPAWDSPDHQNPRPTLTPCGTERRPELYWRWGGA
ncbi:ricin-type beta-trefoil lectin domain protein [Streptomyces sp. NPDC094049]|uniref:ricin-type beta-trefoil lectin domain protein n=1 Tax=Streptomyces sp. NPDC094049 TaxID=3154987 RepID=UPI00332EB847